MTETLWSENFATIAEQARAYKTEQETRPIFQTVRLLDEAYEMSREVANKGYDNQHLANAIWRTAFVQKHDIANIQQNIADTQDALYALIAKLEDAKASLAGAEEAGA